jgi:O-acetyl-ADP-ribose deacetylase (regulator of RNase III)
MIHYTDTTVFNIAAGAIVNTVNCVGVMGNGLALECRLRYPEMFEDYVGRCRRGGMEIGKPYVFRYPGGPAIINLAMKIHWKYPSRLEWVRQGLAGLVALLDREGIATLAIPPLGCNLGKLDWVRVRPLMEHFLGQHPVEATVCFDHEECATGVEGEMVDLLNNTANLWWINELRPSKVIVESILNALPIRHFREMRQLPGVGKRRYEQLHRLLYCRVTGAALPELKPPRLLQQLCLLL